MEGKKSAKKKNKAGLSEDGLDEDETRLIIDEGSMPSENNQRKLRHKRVSSYLRIKSRKDVEETSNPYPCPECGKLFKRKVKLQTHLLTHKSKEELECEKCGRTFSKPDALFNHTCTGVDNNYKCPECDEWFRLKKDLTVHQETHKTQLLCDESSNENDPIDNIDFSSFVASFVKWPVPCVKCGSELANLESYNVHMSTHKELEACVCLVCKMKFSCRDDFFLHKEVCHIEGVFECTYCNKRFHAQKKLTEHLQCYSEKDKCCFVCGLNFVKKNKFMAHMHLHKGIAFPCEKCRKIFKCKGKHKDHVCASENPQKSEKNKDEQCPDSMSGNEESEIEDVDGRPTSESCICKVCGCTFEHRKGLKLHLRTHFQCVQCKKYFKSQMDLNMHTFLLGEEKLFSCSMCKAVLHGSKELESHLNNHLMPDYTPSDDLDWEDNNENLQNIISGLNGAESFTPLERSLGIGGVKINKVMIAGNNSLICSTCGKFVYLRHNLSELLDSNKLSKDSDEEYVFISRFEYPFDMVSHKESTHCTCQHSSDILSSLIERSPSKSLNEYECQEPQKINKSSPIKSTHSQSPKTTCEASGNNKSKIGVVNSEATKDTTPLDVNLNDRDSNNDRDNNSDIVKSKAETSKTSDKEANCDKNIDSDIVKFKAKNSKTADKSINCVLIDNSDVMKPSKEQCKTSDEDTPCDKPKNSDLVKSKTEVHKTLDKDYNINKPNDSETMKSKPETNSTSLTSTSNVLNKDSSNSPVTNRLEVVTNTDCQNKSDASKECLSNLKFDGKEVILPQKPGINIVTLDNKTVSLPIKLVNPVAGNGVTPPQPLKLFVPAGLFSKPITVGSVSQLLNRSDIKKSVSSIIDSVKNQSQSNVNTVNNENITLVPSVEKSNGKTSETNVTSLSKEVISQQLKEKKVYLSHLLAQKLGLTIPPSHVGDLLLNNRNITLESNSSENKGEKRPQQDLKPRRGRPPKIPKIIKEIKAPKSRVRKDKAVPITLPQYVKTKTGPDGCTPVSTSSNESNCVPGNNVTIKVEPQNSKSDDEEEEEETNGMKNEFLASDVFIKEEEWDIVDF